MMAAGINKTPRIVPDLIQKSKLISKGPPDRYRLLTNRNNIDEKGSVSRWTFGQRDVNMKNKIVLMVGETGTGKTTLINAMVNYILGVKFTDEVWFEITEEEGGGGDKHMSDQSKSQTTDITVYEVFTSNNPISLTIIDTPGYGDTRGTEYDGKVAKTLYELFHSETGVKEIDAVCLVVKATENRLSDRQQYIFDAVLSLFGKDIEDNIVIFFTHSDGLPPDDALNAVKKAAISCRMEDEEPVHFTFNNRQTKKRNKKYNRDFARAWTSTEDSLNDFFSSLKEQNRKELAQTKRVLFETRRLEACVSNLQSRIEFMECKAEELNQIQKVLQENQEKIKRNENFTFTVTKYEKKFVQIENASWWDRKATSCSVCKENCHLLNCWSAYSPWWCVVMKSNQCTACTGKCHYNKHVRESKKYITLTETVAMTFEELEKEYEGNHGLEPDTNFDSNSYKNVKNEFEINKRENEEKVSVEEKLKEVLIKNKTERVDLVDEAFNTIEKLSVIALKTNSAFIISSLDFLIPRAEETGKVNYVEKMKELRKIQPQSEEQVNAAISYARLGFNKVKSLFNTE